MVTYGQMADACRALQVLMDDPQPGLFTWNEAVGRAKATIDNFFGNGRSTAAPKKAAVTFYFSCNEQDEKKVLYDLTGWGEVVTTLTNRGGNYRITLAHTEVLHDRE